jgi:hypothetical protein
VGGRGFIGGQWGVVLHFAFFFFFFFFFQTKKV